MTGPPCRVKFSGSYEKDPLSVNLIEARMYAVFRTGGKQFRAQPGERLKVPSLAVDTGATVTFDDVLLLSDGEDVKVGHPTLDGATVKAEVMAHGRGKKVIVFKRKRRKGYRRKQGHRQNYTEIQVGEIVG